MKLLTLITALIFIALYLTGCAGKPLPANPYKTETIYLYIDEDDTFYQEMVKIIKEQLPKKTDEFNKHVTVLDSKDNLPTDGMLLELTNFRKSVGWNMGMYIGAFLDYTISSNKTNLVLVKKQAGIKTRWYGYEGLTEGIVKYLQNYLNIYTAEKIDERRIPVWIDDKCVKFCGNIAREYRAQ